MLDAGLGSTTVGLAGGAAAIRKGVWAMRDILGRPVVTAAELEVMTEDERQASFEASIVWDLSVLPPEYVARLRAAAEERIARRDAAQRGIPHAS